MRLANRRRQELRIVGGERDAAADLSHELGRLTVVRAATITGRPAARMPYRRLGTTRPVSPAARPT